MEFDWLKEEGTNQERLAKRGHTPDKAYSVESWRAYLWIEEVVDACRWYVFDHPGIPDDVKRGLLDKMRALVEGDPKPKAGG